MNNKIMKSLVKPAFLSGIFLAGHSLLSAQILPVSNYGLPYINHISLYRESLTNHPEKEMLPLSDIPGVILDLRYASDSNFMHKKLYPENTTTTFLRQPVYRALENVSRELRRLGLALVVFDAYRPYSVTAALWSKVQDERYAANPAKGSGHNRGIAVDLTLADFKTHRLLPMPSGFDNFSDSAHHGFMGTDPWRVANRELLKWIMEKYGFIPLSSEWWHYSWPNAEQFEVLDLNFLQLSNLQKN